MAVEQPPRPEQDSPLEGGLFNVEAMTDGQVIALQRALGTLAEIGLEEGETADAQRQLFDGISENLTSNADSLWFDLAAAVRGEASRDPERVKGLVRHLAWSALTLDRDFAATTVKSLVGHDYGFTRDTLVFLISHDEGTIAEYDVPSSRYMESACDALEELREQLTIEQIADFKASLDFRAGGWASIAAEQLEPRG